MNVLMAHHADGHEIRDTLFFESIIGSVMDLSRGSYLAVFTGMVGSDQDGFTPCRPRLGSVIPLVFGKHLHIIITLCVLLLNLGTSCPTSRSGRLFAIHADTPSCLGGRKYNK